MRDPRESIYRTFADRTCWPVPGEALGELQWQARYGSVSTLVNRRYEMASVISAYAALIALPSRQRNARIRAMRRAATIVEDKSEPGTATSANGNIESDPAERP